MIGGFRAVFAEYGLLHGVVSDNGPQFASQEYQTFFKNEQDQSHSSSSLSPC